MQKTINDNQQKSNFEYIDGDLSLGLMLVCDHASNALPEQYGTLGLDEAHLARHIAYDIGIADTTRKLAAKLGVPALLSCYSRLLIDLNRGEDDPTLIMRLSDGAVVPGNARFDEAEKRHRIEHYYRGYHTALDEKIDQFLEQNIVPALFSLHSFTPHWKGVPRPWHATILWDKDPRFVDPLLAALNGEDGIICGENVPYRGELEGDCMNRHGTRRGLAHALIELRQDLITQEKGQEEWAARMARIIGDILADEAHRANMQRIAFYQQRRVELHQGEI